MSQSWITIKPHDTEHKSHVHPNSIISGVLYYGKHNENTPGIKFFNSHNIWDFKKNRSLRIKPKFDNELNSYTMDSIEFKFKPNTLILFPSWLEHGVSYNNTNKNRKSIAFNVLPKTLGYYKDLTELKLNNENHPI